MAKLKDKIKDLQTQYGISEDAAKAILSLHDGDLQDASAAVAAEQEKVVKWNQWYQENAPNIQASLAELEQARAELDAFKKAGITITSPTTVTKPVEPNLEELLNQRDQTIYGNFSAVQKDIYNIQRYHMQHYKELPDLDPIEKLINEKKMTPWAAYQDWVAPMEKERTTKELTDKITKELTEKFQNESTRSGVNGYLLQNKSSLTGEEVTSPLDEVAREQAEAASKTTTTKPGDAPSELELMADFVGTMRHGRMGTA